MSEIIHAKAGIAVFPHAYTNVAPPPDSVAAATTANSSGVPGSGNTNNNPATQTVNSNSEYAIALLRSVLKAAPRIELPVPPSPPRGGTCIAVPENMTGSARNPAADTDVNRGIREKSPMPESSYVSHQPMAKVRFLRTTHLP